ncbi:MAG: hypothetical protein MJ092_02940 [Lachnospiraceae bacterium]|nr:hypothetical protein [Lachnospiraceae bacterium]
MTNCCKGYGMAFSSYLQDGGYIQADGEYVLEKSVCIVFIDPDEMLVEEVGKDLCAFLNQETVLVTIDEVERYFISDSIQ